MLKQHQPATWFEDTERLPAEPGLVGNTRRRAVGVGPVEACVQKRQRGCAALENRDPIGHTARGVQLPCRIAECRRNIDTGHRAPVPRHDPACRAADTATDIEDCLTSLLL